MSFQCARCHAEIDRSFKACPHCGELVTNFLRRYADEPVDGKYRLIERLGAGGMGEVYKVEHVFLRATRVIKVIRPQISESEDARQRFLREAQLATKVQHPNVATLHDFSALPDGSHYMVWEYIDGENLAQVIRRRGVLPARYAIRLTIQALAGLEAIHRAGIVHRDISPENLMITRDESGNERMKIIDLGVAKAEEGGYTATQTGIFVGKLRYSSPEHLGFLAEGEKIDGRADLYSVAIVLYEMLTGRPPFEATSPHQYILHHSRETNVQSLDLTRVPDALRALLTRALERDRTKRFATARQFAEALQHVESSLPTDEDDTLRLTPPSGTTIRAEFAPKPATPPRRAGTTIRTDFGQPPPPTVVERPRSQTALFLVIALLVIAFGVLATLHYRSQPAATVKNATVTPPQPVVPPATTRVEVASPAPQRVVPPAATSTEIAYPEPHPTTTHAVPPKKAAVKPQVTVTEPTTTYETAHVTPAPAPTPIHTYVDGGNSSSNEAALSYAQEHLHGVSRVSLDISGDAGLGKQLAELVRHNNLTISDSSNVVIHFNGTLTRLRFGRKQRAAQATITKNGRTIFRYELRPEEYRVGDNPAEAFARVLSDVFGR